MAWTRYLTTNSAATAFALTEGLVASVTNTIIPVEDNLIARFMFFGVGANNTTFDARLYGIEKMADQNLRIDPAQVCLHLIGAATSVTLSTATACTGKTGGIAMATTDFLADTLTWTVASEATTPDGVGSDMETALSEGTSQAYSPAADVPGVLIVPCIGRYAGLIVEFDMTGATSGNALYSLDRV